MNTEDSIYHLTYSDLVWLSLALVVIAGKPLYRWWHHRSGK